MDLKIAGKTALITGGSKGIGRATAEVFAAEGCNVIIVSRTAEMLAQVKSAIAQKSNVRVDTVAADLSDSRNVDKLAQDYPDIDILVNNAGAIPGGGIAEVDEARWRAAWDLKVYGYINMTRAFYQAMKTRKGGVIINILGVAGERLEPTYIAGSTGNAGLIAFTKTMGAASAADNIRVVGVNPGPIDTERLETLMRKRALDQFGDAERWREFHKPLPFGRAGRPEEVAHMVAFLASDLASYISGTVITIDGGLANRGLNG
jgi:3-oxoacyl-[acyl-carrier protein] reductase